MPEVLPPPVQIEQPPKKRHSIHPNQHAPYRFPNTNEMNKTFANYRKLHPPTRSFDINAEKQLTRENLAALEGTPRRKVGGISPLRATALLAQTRREPTEKRCSPQGHESKEKAHLYRIKKRIRGATQSPRILGEQVRAESFKRQRDNAFLRDMINRPCRGASNNKAGQKTAKTFRLVDCGKQELSRAPTTSVDPRFEREL